MERSRSVAEITPSAALEDVRVGTFAGADKARLWNSESPGMDGIARHGQATVEEKQAYHVDDALTHIGFGRFQWFMLFYTGIAWAGDAMEMMLLSFLGPFIMCEWEYLTASQESLLTTMVFVGMLFGVNFFGFLSDACGRKIGFFSTAVFSSVMGFGSAVAPTYEALVFFRTMVGIGLGGVPVAFTLFMEFLPSANRGKWLVIIESFWTIGTFVEAGIAGVVLPKLGWRWLLAISAIPQVLLVLLYPLLPESPHWLASKGRRDDANRVLMRVAKANKSSLPKGILQVAEKPVQETSADLAGGPGKKKRRACGCCTPFSNIRSSVGALYSRNMRRTTILLHIVWFCCAIVYYGLVMLTTQLHVEEGRECVDGKPNFNSEDYLDIFITTLAEVPGLVLAELTVDRLGRRWSMGSALIIGACSSLFLTFGLSMNAETVILFVSRCFTLCAFTVLYIFTPEAYPTSSRSLGMGVNNAFSRAGGMIAPFIAVNLPEAGKEIAAELLLAGLSLLGGISSLFLPFDTAGMEFKDEYEDAKNPGLLEMAELTPNCNAMFVIGTPDSASANDAAHFEDLAICSDGNTPGKH